MVRGTRTKQRPVWTVGKGFALKRKSHETQEMFDFEAVPDSPRQHVDIVDAPKLDAAGHRWWASTSWAKQTELIAKAHEWPEHGAELAAISKQWKEIAETHQARAFALEPERRHL